MSHSITPASGLPVAVPFEPERNDVRENVFWSISLALNVSQSLLSTLTDLRLCTAIGCCTSSRISVLRDLFNANKDPRSLQSCDGNISSLAECGEIPIANNRFPSSASYCIHTPLCGRSRRQSLFDLSFARWHGIAHSLHSLGSLLRRVRDSYLHLGVYDPACNISIPSFFLHFHLH
jgi:hypothetical protein